MLLGNLRIGAKLMLAPGLGLVLLAVMAIAGYAGLQRQDKALQAIYQVRFANYQKSSQIDAQARGLHTEVYRYLSWLKANYSAERVKGLEKDIKTDITHVKQALTDFQAIADSEQERALIALASSAINAYQKGVDNVLDLADSDPSTATTMMEPATKAFSTLITALDQLSSKESELSELAYQDARVALQTSVQQFIALFLVAMTAMAVLTLLVRRNVMLSVRTLQDLASSLHQRDLRSSRTTFTQDEIGEAARWLQQTVEQLRETVSALQLTSDGTSAAAREIAAGNQSMSSRTEQQASNLEVTSHSIEELTAAVRQNAESARLADELARMAMSIARKSGSAMREVESTMKTIVDSGRQIGDIVTFIDGIAFQTNILALNAAVEAARAGEAGRGFQVVAGEVRTLAQRSAKAAKEVRGLVGMTSDRAQMGAKLVTDAGTVVQEVVKSIEDVTALVGEISNASRQQALRIEQVHQAIADIDQNTQQNAALGEQAAAAAASLDEQAHRLATSLKTFIVDADDA